MRQREIRVALDCFVKKAQGPLAVLARIARTAPAKEIARPQKQIVGVEVACRVLLESFLFLR